MAIIKQVQGIHETLSQKIKIKIKYNKKIDARLVIPEVEKWRQENQEFESYLDKMKPYLHIYMESVVQSVYYLPIVHEPLGSVHSTT